MAATPPEGTDPGASRLRAIESRAQAGIRQAWSAVEEFRDLAAEQSRRAEALERALDAEREGRATAERAATTRIRDAEAERDRSAKNAARLSTLLSETKADAAEKDREQTAALDRAHSDLDEARKEVRRLQADQAPAPASGTNAAEAKAPKVARKRPSAAPSSGLKAAPKSESVPGPASAPGPQEAGAGLETLPEASGVQPAAVVPAVATAEETVSETFRTWCVATSPVVGKVAFFAERVRQALPGAAVAAVYRDANSQALPVTFRGGGSSPVEYWLVAVEGRHWLLPQPLGGQQFRELAPCFEGATTPAALAAVRPAEVRAVGPEFELARPGHVA